MFPLGVFTRPRRDWIVTRCAGGYGSIGAIALKYAYVGLYNNATDGSYVGVYGVTTDPSLLQWGAGNPIACTTPGNALKFDAALPWGLTGTLNSASSFGNGIMLFGLGNASASYLEDTPITILPPGYSFWARSINVAEEMTAAFIWGPWR